MSSEKQDPGTDTSGTTGDGAAVSDEPLDAVARALAPLIEQADHLGGFAIKYADGRSAECVKDRSTVEVRFYYRHRHPSEVDRAMGMLQGHGFQPEKRKRGAGSDLCVFLRVPVGEPEDGDREYSAPRRDEQSTF